MHGKSYTQEDLDALMEKTRAKAIVECEFLRECAGGVPAGEKGLAAFVEHHLGLVPDTPDFEDAIKRIEKEEIGERETTAEGGEVDTAEVYQVNVIRHSEHGAYLAEHQIKALLKQAASRIGLFVARRGSKGDLAEMGTVLAHGDSLQDPTRPWEIHLRNGDGAASTRYQEISGSVNSPKGKKSIMHHTEVAAEGSRFSFALLWPDTKLKADDLVSTIAAATQIGLGSCLSLGYGRFRVNNLEIIKPSKPKAIEE